MVGLFATLYYSLCKIDTVRIFLESKQNLEAVRIKAIGDEIFKYKALYGLQYRGCASSDVKVRYLH